MRRTLLPFLGLLACLLLACFGPAPAAHAQAAATGPDYSVAILPVMPPSEIKRRWQPLLDQLTRETGLRFHFRFYEDFESFNAGLLKEEADFAVMSPLHIWRLRNHYRPQLRGSLPLTGMVVVRQDSPVHQLADLRGRHIAIQEGDNLSANILVGQTLREQKIEINLRLVKTESNALRSVVLGKADAAVVNNYILKFLPPEIVTQIRILYRTADLPPPPIAVSNSVNFDDVKKVKVALLHLRETHAALLEGILMPDITEADMERDYSIVGKLIPGEAGNASR